jgi:hypothetical protein
MRSNRRSVRADGLRPMHHARRRPFQVCLMRLWTVLRIRHRPGPRSGAKMRSPPGGSCERSPSSWRLTYLDQFPGQNIRRAADGFVVTGCAPTELSCVTRRTRDTTTKSNDWRNSSAGTCPRLFSAKDIRPDRQFLLDLGWRPVNITNEKLEITTASDSVFCTVQHGCVVADQLRHFQTDCCG